MADIFLDTDLKSLLNGKRILFIGDSNVRATYKDWLWLYGNNTIMPERFLKSKLEKSFAGDSLVACSRLHKGRDFREVREYQDQSLYVQFAFVTKCLADEVQDMFAEFRSGKKIPPDIVIFNSCLWDISRWGPNGVTKYRENMTRLMPLMHESLPAEALVIFTTTLPLSLSMRGGFLVEQVNFLTAILPYEVMEANLFIRELVVVNGFDVVDLHFHMRHQIHRRRADGVHWEPLAVRHITNILLTHISLSLGVPLPGRARAHALARMASVETAPWVDPAPNRRPEIRRDSSRSSQDSEQSGSRDRSRRHSSHNSKRNVAAEDHHSKRPRYNTPVMANLYCASLHTYDKPRGGLARRGNRPLYVHPNSRGRNDNPWHHGVNHQQQDQRYPMLQNPVQNYPVLEQAQNYHEHRQQDQRHQQAGAHHRFARPNSSNRPDYVPPWHGSNQGQQVQDPRVYGHPPHQHPRHHNRNRF